MLRDCAYDVELRLYVLACADRRRDDREIEIALVVGFYVQVTILVRRGRPSIRQLELKERIAGGIFHRFSLGREGGESEGCDRKETKERLHSCPILRFAGRRNRMRLQIRRLKFADAH